jgi:hypothetical protein
MRRSVRGAVLVVHIATFPKVRRATQTFELVEFWRGIAGLLALTRPLTRFLFGVKATDPLSCSIVTAILASPVA